MRVLVLAGVTVLLLVPLGGLDSRASGERESPSLSASAIIEAPATRTFHDMAYDVESDRTILYGGLGVIDTLGDTWAYDLNTNTWENMNPNPAPPTSNTHATAYDTESDRTILFGGVTVLGVGIFAELNETWAYDYNSNTWTNMEPALPPRARLGHRMAYDADSDLVILLGGHTGFGSSAEAFRDTWAYDYNANIWTELAPAGQPTANHNAVAYDAESDRVIHFGGEIGGGIFVNETWTYDTNANTWTRQNPSLTPTPRWMHGMAYDVESDRAVLFGGAEDPFGGNTNETWVYDFNTDLWTETQPALSPRARRAHRMAYDVESDRTVLFGGPTNETWSYDTNANTWTPLTRPASPSLTATAGDDEVELAWEPPSFDGGAPITNYRIYRGTLPGSSVLLVELGDTSAYTDVDVTLDVTYSYQVSAVTAAGEGFPSDEKMATPSDTIDPTIAIASVDPTVGFLTASVNGTASDNVALAQVELSTDGTNWSLASGTSSWSGSVALVCGDNEIFARATDTSGNAAEAEIRPMLHLDCPSPFPLFLSLGIASAVGAALAIAWLMVRRRVPGT